MQPTRIIRSYLRPAVDQDGDRNVRELHSIYDRLFKDIVSANWSNSSDGNVESPQGYFALITIERAEAQQMFDNFVTEDAIEEHYVWSMQKWPSQLAGHYVTQENSDGIIRVWAYDSHEDALGAYATLEQEFGEWYDADQAEEHGLDGL